VIFSLLVACGEPEVVEDVDDVEVVSEPVVVPVREPERPRFEQADLEGREDAVRLRGALLCEEPGPFHVRVFPPHPDDVNRRFDSHPRGGFLTEVVLDAPGDYSILVPVGRERLLLAWRDADGDGHPSLDEAPFFADAHGRSMDLDAHISGLDLDCAVFPTRAVDNSKTATYGERGEQAPTARRLESQGLDVFDGSDPGKANDIEDILQAARDAGIDVDDEEAPVNNSKFNDGAM